MYSSKISHVSLLAFLLITIKGIESLTTETKNLQQDQPFWQLVLRDFVFRTVASSELDGILHKKLLDAQFYDGPLREVFNDEDTLLCSGNVYQISNERWIFCQDNCVNCDVCQRNKNSTVKWILKRVKRWTSSGRPKWDQQLTVLPQSYEEPRAITGRLERTGHLTEMQQADRKGQRFLGNVESHDDSIKVEKKQSDDHFRVSENNQGRFIDPTRLKRYRTKLRPIGRSGRMAIEYPQKDLARIKSPVDRLKDDLTPRLIMGIDQRGEKHLVHVVPVHSPIQEVEHSGYSTSSQGSYQRGILPRVSRMIQESQDEIAYHKLIERILNSLNNHRNFIETFLFPGILQPETSDEVDTSPYLSYPGKFNGDERLAGKNEHDYRSLSRGRDNRYDENFEYQAEEEDKSYRHYADETPEANISERGKQSDDYEPYGMSAIDRSQEERSSPRAEDERRRTDYFGKLTDSSSTFGHEELDEYHAQRETTDSGFSINRKIFDNSSNQTLGNSRLDTNQSESRIEDFPVESTTIKLETDKSDDSL